MRKLMLTAVVMMAFTVVGPPSAAMAGGNSQAAMTCQSDYAALGFVNRGACTSFYARGGGDQPPPPTGEPALSVVGTVYDSCVGLGDRCWLGIYGTGLMPGSTVSLYEEGICCELTFMVESNGTMTVEGIFSCGGTGTRSFAWIAEGTTSSGDPIAAEPLLIPERAVAGSPCDPL